MFLPLKHSNNVRIAFDFGCSKCHFTCTISFAWFSLSIYVDSFFSLARSLPFISNFSALLSLFVYLTRSHPIDFITLRCLLHTHKANVYAFSGKSLLIFLVLTFTRNALNNYSICSFRISNPHHHLSDHRHKKQAIRQSQYAMRANHLIGANWCGGEAFGRMPSKNGIVCFFHISFFPLYPGGRSSETFRFRNYIH